MKTWTGVCRDKGNDKAKGSRREPGKLSTKRFLGRHRFSICTTVGPSCSQMCSHFYGLLLDEGHSPAPWCQVGVWLISATGMLGNRMPTEAGSGPHRKTHPPLIWHRHKNFSQRVAHLPVWALTRETALPGNSTHASEKSMLLHVWDFEGVCYAAKAAWYSVLPFQQKMHISAFLWVL